MQKSISEQAAVTPGVWGYKWCVAASSDGGLRLYNMDPLCLVSVGQVGCGLRCRGYTLGPLVQIEHRLNTTAYLSAFADHIHPFTTTA